MSDPKLVSRKIPAAVVLIFVLLGLGIAAGMVFYAREYARNLLAERSEDLVAVADLKVGQIAHWRRERLGDARLSLEAVDFARRLENFLTDPADETNKAVIRQRLAAHKQYGDYEDVIFCDSLGSARISAEPVSLDSPLCMELMKEAERTRSVFATDFEKDPGGRIHLIFGCPIFGRNSSLIGAILLVTDPQQYLIPLIESWPTPSKTAETLLVRRQGDSVVFLNRLRHYRNSAMDYSIPLSRVRLLAAQAVAGSEGAISGEDYRGIEVLGAARRVPDTNWYLVAKMDRAEALAPLRGTERTALLIVGLLVVTAGSILILLWRQQQLRHYRRQYESEVRNRELAGRFEHLTRSANDIILLFDNECNIVEANERAVSAYGYARDELLRLRINDLRDPTTLAELPEQWREVHQNRSLMFETRHRRRDGSVFPVEVSSGTVEFEGKKWVQSIIRDVTERKKAEADLRRANRGLRMLITCNEALVRSANEQDLFDGICRIAIEIGGYRLAWVGLAESNERKTVRLVAKAGTSDDFLETVGITWADEPAGRTPMGVAIRTGHLSLVRGADDVEQESFRKYAQALGIVAGVGIPLHVEGEVIGALAVYSTDLDSFDPGEVRVLNELADDLSFGIQTIRRRELQHRSEEALRQSQEQLWQWQKMESIGRLAGSLAHDFNNYLTVIDGYCDLLLSDLRDDDPMRGPLEEIRKSGGRVTDLTGQLLAFSRKPAQDMKPVSLADILGDSRNILSRLAGKNVDLVVEVSRDLWHVKADAGQIQQVLMNLTANARDAMPSGGKLTVRARNYRHNRETAAAETAMKSGDYVLLSVEDNGLGMDPETMSHIFEPFFTTKPSGGGTGFGLATVYGIVRQANGRISVESQPGKGTVFQIYIPRATDQYKEARQASGK